MSNVITRGNLPAYVVKSLRRDKIGIYSGSVTRTFQVGEENQRIDPLWLDPALAPAPWGLPCVDATAAITPPVCVVTYNYEGASGGDNSFSEDEVTFELDTTMAEEPIETHPSFAALKKLYGWDQDERRFNEFLAQVPKEGALAGTKEKGKPNPLFGVDSYLAIGCVYRKTYAARTLPAAILRGIGTIVEKPPDIGQFHLPSSISKRNWLKLAPKISKRGSAIQISEEWMLSGPSGWKKPIYDKGQLEK
jgi:hypothetical protein